MDGIRRDPLTDSQLDREIEAALGIEPSPEFLARARMRVASEPVVESGFSRIRNFAFDPLWPVALAGIVLAVVVPGLMREKPAVSQTAARSVSPLPVEAAPVEPTLRTVVTSANPAGPAPRGRQQSVARATKEMHTLPLQLSPVLFSEEDRLAFARLVTAVADGTVPEKVIQALGEEDMTPLAITPLVIDPLPLLARVDRQGEGQW